MFHCPVKICNDATKLFDIDVKCRGKICSNGSRCKHGDCICPTDCNEDDYKPVCGSDGHTVSIMKGFAFHLIIF